MTSSRFNEPNCLPSREVSLATSLGSRWNSSTKDLIQLCTCSTLQLLRPGNNVEMGGAILDVNSWQMCMSCSWIICIMFEICKCKSKNNTNISNISVGNKTLNNNHWLFSHKSYLKIRKMITILYLLSYLVLTIGDVSNVVIILSRFQHVMT